MDRKVAGVLFCLVLGSGFPLAKAGVEVEWDRKVDFSGFKTYAWMKGTEAPSPLTEKRIHTAVEDELKARSLTLAEEAPDFQIVTHASSSTSERLDVNGFGYAGYGYTQWQDFGPAVMNIRDSSHGTLVVDILDGESGRLIWRGVASENLGIDSNPEKVGKKVFSLVKQMFRKFPVGNGKD